MRATNIFELVTKKITGVESGEVPSEEEYLTLTQKRGRGRPRKVVIE